MQNPNELNLAFNEALLLAKKAGAEDEVPVGAVVIYQSQIIGRGYNRREGTQSPTSHAEIHAIEEAAKHLGSWRLLDCILVVTLEPCLMCLGALQQSRIEKVVYGAEDKKGGALSLGYHFHSDERLNHRFEASYERREECSKILSEFFSTKRKSKNSQGN